MDWERFCRGMGGMARRVGAASCDRRQPAGDNQLLTTDGQQSAQDNQRGQWGRSAVEKGVTADRETAAQAESMPGAREVALPQQQGSRQSGAEENGASL